MDLGPTVCGNDACVPLVSARTWKTLSWYTLVANSGAFAGLTSLMPFWNVYTTCSRWLRIFRMFGKLHKCCFYRLGPVLIYSSWWHEKYMPGEILYQLYRYCPQASVHIASSKIALCERINQKHTSSPQLSCVRSIEAEWCDGEYDGPIKPNAKGHFPAQLRDIICRCQNLESLALISKRKFRPRSRDISSDLERKEAEAKLNVRGLITLKQGDILPQVKNLHFRRMRFGPAQSTLWATQLRWQNIKHLSLIEISWVHLLPKITTKGCFHSLEALEMSIPNLASSYGQDRFASFECINQLHAFLKELPPLKMFIGYGFPQDTLAVLAKYHSKSLSHLRFRYELSSNLDAGTTSWEQPSFRASIHNLHNLFNQFPNLHSLGLNVDWTSNEELVSLLTITKTHHMCNR